MLEPTDRNIDGLTDVTLHARFLQVTARKKKVQRVKPSIPRITKLSPSFAPRLSEDDAKQQAHLFKALADPTRLLILDVLSRHEGEVCVFELVMCFTLEQPTISHHLRLLRDAGLIDCHKLGLWAYYYVHRDALYRACSTLEQLGK